MDTPNQNHTVYLDGRAVGKLEIYPLGLMTVFSCACFVSISGIPRLMCRAGGENISIGVLIPEQAGWALKKSFSRAALQRLGLGEIEGAYLAVRPLSGAAAATLPDRDNVPPGSPAPGQTAVSPPPAGSSWAAVSDASGLFEDPELAQICRSLSGALLREAQGGQLLAIPVSSTAPFPMMPVFCFGKPAVISGREYVLFKIQNGNLC